LQWGDVDWNSNTIFVKRSLDLRHTYTSLLIAQGENIKFIQSQLGHASIQTTMDRYGHIIPNTNHGAGERLDRMVFGEGEAVPVVAKIV